MPRTHPGPLRPTDYTTLTDILHWRAQHQPDRVAYTFLGDGESIDQTLTYAELDRQARTIAVLLQHSGATGARALLLYPPGLAYIVAFLGCLYAGVVAVPAYPPTSARLERTLPRRLRVIVDDAQPMLALTTDTLLPIGAALAAQDPIFGRLRWIATDALPDTSVDWRAAPIRPDALAFLQYTSGSTAAPKGVMLSHANVLHNSGLIEHGFGHTADSRGVIWLPPYHDMGLIGGILQPLYGGFPVTLMSPLSFLQRPLRWLEAVARFGATTSGGPNFAYELCVRRSTPEQRAGLDLSTWQVAFTGAEPVHAATLDRFAAAFAGSGFRRAAFYPCYGLAEATLIVSGGKLTDASIITLESAALEQHRIAPLVGPQPGARTFVSCGRPLGDQAVVIIDPQTRSQCRDDQVGEIWVHGPSVAQGYWHRPGQTAEVFAAQPAEHSGRSFLRTGDLGFVHDGALFVTGRLKDLIIIRGRNHYPQDIELTVEESHPALRPNSGAAFAVDLDGEERLVVVQEVERQQRHGDLRAVARAIRLAVAAAHELQVATVVLLKPGGLPKTSSGKVQRHACRTLFLDGMLDELERDVLPPADAPEIADDGLSRAAVQAAPAAERPALLTEYLRTVAARVLQIQPAQLDPQVPLGSLGLDSLGAVELQHTIERQLDCNVPMVVFLQDTTIAGLAAVLAADLATPSDASAWTMQAGPSAALHTTDEPLTPGQRALWLLHQVAPESTAYTIASAGQIDGPVDLAALHGAFQVLVERHPALRTTFQAMQGEPRQHIHPSMPVDFQIVQASQWHADDLAARLLAETQRPFELTHGPLLRVRVFVRAAQAHVLLLTVNHIVADLWSLAVMAQELGQIYSAQCQGHAAALPALERQYADYVRWQAGYLAGPAGEQLWQYWRQQLAGSETVLALPTDRPRPPVQTYAGATCGFTVPAQLTARLKALAQTEGVTLYMILLAAWETLLYRYTGQRDFLVGSPIAGRSRAAWAGLVGYFVNPLVLRASIAGDPSFAALLTQVRQTVLGAFEHQDFPFPLLVERMQPARDPSRSPLFQVMFVLQKPPLGDAAGLAGFALADGGAQIDLAGLSLRSVALDQRVAQFDLTLMIGERGAELGGSLLYNTDLFDADTIARLAQHFQTLLAAVVASPWLPLSQLPLLTEHERRQQLCAWNATTVAYPVDEHVLRPFEIHAAGTPDRTAVLFEDTRLSYGELNRRANQLAHYLQRLGVGPDVLVGICLDRSLSLVVALLAVLKAGGTYVPLDPTYPRERLELMIEDARAAVLLTQSAVVDLLNPGTLAQRSGHMMQLIDLDRDWPTIAEELETNLATPGWGDHLAYAIFTSGSTGRPKGTLVSRRSLLNLCRWYEAHCPITPLSRVLLTISFSFDASFKNMLVPLLAGGQLILADAGFYDPARLLTVIERHAVTTINTTPSLMHPVIELAAARDYQQLASLEYLALGGEPMVLSKLRPWIESPHCGCRFFNIYGPTECTDISTSYALAPSQLDTLPTVPIGGPIHNARAYVLDRQLNLLPAGVAGELCIGGVGLARGYLNQPRLTAERFVPNPFADWGLETDASLIPNPQSSIQHGDRLYKTGDLVRWRRDGNLEFLGRIDQQIKLRGYRIELGEIEAALTGHPLVREAVVVVHERAPGDQRLVAYAVPKAPTTEHQDPRLGDTALDAAELRRFLQAGLPPYMVPSVFVLLEALPLTPSGKLDRQALPAAGALEAAALARTTPFVAPQSETEQRIAQIWRDVLSLEAVGLHDNFFELGGHSLLMAQVHSRLQALHPRAISMIEMFKYPTIRSLADHLVQSQDTQLLEQRQQQADERFKDGRNRLKEQRKQRQRLRDS